MTKGQLNYKLRTIAKEGTVLEFAVCHKQGANINGGTRTDTTLIKALQAKNLDIVNYIIDHNGNFNARPFRFEDSANTPTALMMCLSIAKKEQDFLEPAIKMIEKGANVNLTDHKGFTVLAYSSYKATEEAFDRILEKYDIFADTANIGRKRIAVCNPLYQILVDPSADIITKPNYLHFWKKFVQTFPHADYNGHVNTNGDYLRGYANIFNFTLRDGLGDSPGENREVLTFLEKAGVDIHDNQHLEGNAAYLAAHSVSSTPETFDTVLKMGVSPDVPCRLNGKTARDVAGKDKRFKIVLERHEAEVIGKRPPELVYSKSELDQEIIQAITQSLREGCTLYLEKDETGSINITNWSNNPLYTIDGKAFQQELLRKVKSQTTQ